MFRKALQLLFILSIASLEVYPQQPAAHAKRTATKVYLEHADMQLYNKNLNADRQVLVGNVCFRHDSTYMYCDSAYFFEATGSLEAFGQVRMEQGDTLYLYGDYLFYNGEVQLAQVRENVRMESYQHDGTIVTLFTDSLNYDRVQNIGYYFEGGLIVDADNELSSLYGQYSPGTRIAVFNNHVELKNPKFTLTSDTLQYDTGTRIATILGPSVITSDSGVIHTSRGWYNTLENTSLLLDRSTVYSGNSMLTGDSLAYNRAQGIGEAFGNILLEDTASKIRLEGQYGLYNERTGYGFATREARCLEYSQGDTLYMHADTFEMNTIDSTQRQLKAYHHVRFFRIDAQGVCDSMSFNTRDSVLNMYTNPVLWNGSYQLFGDTIAAYFRDSTIHHAHVKRFAFATQRIDSTMYNQLKGNDLKAYFEDRLIRRVEIDGNAETIYFPIDRDSIVIGMNVTKSSYLTFWIKDNQLEKLKIWPQPLCELIPLPQLMPEQKQLNGFRLYDDIRPLHKDDIYRRPRRTVEEPPKRNNKFVY